MTQAVVTGDRTQADGAAAAYSQQAMLVARLERLPMTRLHIMARLIVGCATFFDGYTSLTIAYALPVLIHQWNMSTQAAGYIISVGYLGQLCGALLFGWLAERKGRLRVTTMTVAVYSVMNLVCVFAWGPLSLGLFRFIQGIGVGGEVPVAGTYINELSTARGRGRFFLLYEIVFGLGLTAAGILGYLAVPVYGWQAMFIIGTVPVVLIAPLRLLLPESPRWLISQGRVAEAEAIITRLENLCKSRGVELAAPVPIAWNPVVSDRHAWRELFSPFYRVRTLMLWVLWLCSYLVINGMVTWLPTLYRSIFGLPLSTSLAYGFTMTGVSVCIGVICGLTIDHVGRRRWFTIAFFVGMVPLLILAATGAKSAIEVLVLATATYATIQTITLSLYLYTGELYPTRMRALGTAFGSAWLRLGSAIGPVLVGWIVGGYGIAPVFLTFAVVLGIGGLVCFRFSLESKGRILEELSP
jgi:MFS transporter, putative metabolite:H+ symporter